MRSIQRRFNKISKQNPVWSSSICFGEAIKKQNFSKQAIHRWFQKLVEKNDYAREEKRTILRHLEEYTKTS